MLKTLLKIANKLDTLGHTKEADLLDSVIRKMAAMGEGAPNYLQWDAKEQYVPTPGEESDLEYNEETGNMEYPEKKTVMRSMSNPPTMTFKEPKVKAKLMEKAKAAFDAMEDCFEKSFEALKSFENMPEDDMSYSYYTRVEQGLRKLNDEDVKERIAKKHVRSNPGNTDSVEDIVDSINELLSIIDESNIVHFDPIQGYWTEEIHNYSDYNFISYHPIEEIIKDIKDKKKYFDLGIYGGEGFGGLNRAAEAAMEIKNSPAYNEIESIENLLSPIVEGTLELKRVVDSCINSVESKFSEFEKSIPSDYKDLEVQTPAAYIMPPDVTGWDRVEETSGEQAMFEESFELPGDVDIAGKDDIDFYDKDLSGDWDD